MLQCLDYWRAQCNAAQLDAFDHELMLQCGNTVIPSTLKNRYQGNIHRALINGKVIHQAIHTGEKKHREAIWMHGPDLGEELACLLAYHDGYLAANKVTANFHKSLVILLQRGVLFEHDGHYCLPAEIVVELRNTGALNSWGMLTSNTLIPILMQLVPADAQAQMLKPKATRNQLAAWLMVYGQQARAGSFAEQLDESDWALLLSLQQCDLDGFEVLQLRYPEIPCVEVNPHAYYNDRKEFSLRKSLEQHIPEQLGKLCRLGLIGIITRNGDNKSATITLCEEAKAVLKPHWVSVRQRIADQLQKHWKAKPCDAEYPAAWSRDQLIWRLWIILHFMPLGITQQGKMRKNDLKKVIAVLKESDTDNIEMLIANMLKGELLKQDGDRLTPLPINWEKWRKTTLATIIKTARGWETWDKQDEKQALALLSKLPVECWLKLDEVVEWLRAQSSGRVIMADWDQLFSAYQNITLHHLNARQRSIYFLPEFRAIVKQRSTSQQPVSPQTISFPAPGWHGADKKSKVHGFISAAGEIQLPPDCNHKVLDQLAEFCNISSIEQMITLQLDEKALQRLGNDKSALKKIRKLLESLQASLPQAVAYMLDKQQSQKAIAQVAATSLVIVLNDSSAIHKLHNTGFTFTQPFKDKPELVLLDASADPHAFLTACNDDGILLDSLIKPKLWISGTASINAWMDVNIDRQDQWLEISYQKTRSSAPKQVIARIDSDYYGSIRIQATRKTKLKYSLLKSTVQLQPKHVLRLRELDEAEVSVLGLDKL